MGYTNVNKPTGAVYTNIAKPTDATYTSIVKPSGGVLIVKGMATGILGPPTYSISRDASAWFPISKPL